MAKTALGSVSWELAGECDYVGFSDTSTTRVV